MVEQPNSTHVPEKIPSASNITTVKPAPSTALSRVGSSVLDIIHASVVLIQEAALAAKNTFVGEDGCEPKHCRVVVLIFASILMCLGIWTFLIWMDDVVGLHVMGHRRWYGFFTPNVPFLGSYISLGLASAQPLISAVWLVVAVDRSTDTLLHWYLKLTMWLTIHPFMVIMYLILYYGRISQEETEIMLKMQMAMFNPNSPNEAEEWRQMHREYKCCGIRNWRDWSPEAKSFQKEKVPPSCCIIEPEMAAMNEVLTRPHSHSDCPEDVDDTNVFRDGCAYYVYKAHNFWVGSLLLATIFSLIITHITLFPASRYFERRKQILQNDYVYTWGQLYCECLCPLIPYPWKKSNATPPVGVNPSEDESLGSRMKTFSPSKVYPSVVSTKQNIRTNE